MAVNEAHKAKLTSMGCPDQVAETVLQSLPANASLAHIEALMQYAPDKSKINWDALAGLISALRSQSLPNIVAALAAFFGPPNPVSPPDQTSQYKTGIQENVVSSQPSSSQSKIGYGKQSDSGKQSDK